MLILNDDVIETNNMHRNRCDMTWYDKSAESEKSVVTFSIAFTFESDQIKDIMLDTLVSIQWWGCGGMSISTRWSLHDKQIHVSVRLGPFRPSRCALIVTSRSRNQNMLWRAGALVRLDTSECVEKVRLVSDCMTLTDRVLSRSDVFIWQWTVVSSTSKDFSGIQIRTVRWIRSRTGELVPPCLSTGETNHRELEIIDVEIYEFRNTNCSTSFTEKYCSHRMACLPWSKVFRSYSGRLLSERFDFRLLRRHMTSSSVLVHWHPDPTVRRKFFKENILFVMEDIGWWSSVAISFRARFCHEPRMKAIRRWSWYATPAPVWIRVFLDLEWDLDCLILSRSVKIFKCQRFKSHRDWEILMKVSWKYLPLTFSRSVRLKCPLALDFPGDDLLRILSSWFM